jgi:hypothetical protein
MSKATGTDLAALLFVLSGAISPAACGGSGGGNAGDGGIVPGFASCTQTETVTSEGQTMTTKVCQEWMGMTAAELEVYRQGCAEATAADAGFTQQRVFARAACSREDALGGCQNVVGGVTQTAWYYADDSGITLASAQALCAQLGGTFVMP